MTTTDILSPSGRIAERLPGYELRPEQIEMAGAVRQAFESSQHLLIEAGTGVGKSFAYLVPAIERATKHGGRVVISTHTIALQEQLIEKDIPFLQSVFPQEFSAVLVKGRSNYVGLRRLARTSGKQKQLFSTGGELDELFRIEDWAYKTEDGSLSDMTTQPSLSVWDRVRSDGDDCMGRKCPHFNACFYQRARRRINNAQLLIVNHALLFSDIALRQQGGSILPDYDHVVLDEAQVIDLMDRLQQLYQAGMGKFLGESITYINENDVNKALRFIRQNPDATQRVVWNLFIQQKFFTNNDFSFINVHNERLFYQNADVLLKILQMWQDIRLTNPNGHNQFLGEIGRASCRERV